MAQRSPLIRSGIVLRALATAATFTSLASMTAFAATHVQNSAAPLQPSSSGTTASAQTVAVTPAPTTRTTMSRTTTLTGRVTTTTAATRTKTHSS